MIYLDNASNTIMRKEIKKIYKEVIDNKFLSNSSSFHKLGRKSRVYIEKAREIISKVLNCDPSEIVFTSGGTEGNNIIIKGIVHYYNIKYIISNKLEHVSVLNTIKFFKKKVKIFFIENDKYGNINLKQLEKILKKINNRNNLNYKTLVTIMSINNEIGKINNIKKIGNLCIKYKSLFHSDFVQLIGHYKVNIKKINCNYFTASAHKFYGPLGVGFIYIKKGYFLKKIILGGNQERGIRSGTENLYGIICMAKSLELSNKNYEKEKKYIIKIKKYCINLLKKNINNLEFNGESNKLKKSIYTILNIRLPKDDLLHIKLDLKNIAISKGSSCYNYEVSHVIKNIINKKKRKKTTSIRISFSIFNKKSDIEIFIYELKRLTLNNQLIKLND
ncbi:MAG: aminotransferase class V-fold PLP-dependent enzyme [Candidatus Shikimatogenerans bostrichidophilus]|nr:MAG: aminotransferase class V-fold PLP-dependent enzyme [Candidatus Shikimatogenerans bostrichidophilus]